MSVRASLSHLRDIKNKSAAHIKRILKSADWNLLKALTEIAYNVLQGNVDICRSVKKRLRKYYRIINRLADQKVSLEVKKAFLIGTLNIAGILKLLIRSVGWLKEWL